MPALSSHLACHQGALPTWGSAPYHGLLVSPGCRVPSFALCSPIQSGLPQSDRQKARGCFSCIWVETLADSKLLQVCQIDAFPCSDTHIFLQIKQEHLLFSLPTNYSTVHLSFHLLQQWPINLSYQGPCGYLRACRRPLDLSLICSSHVRTSQYHPIQGVVVP